MAELLFTDAFMDDMLQIYSKKVYEAVFRAIELLPSVPVLGSTDLPDASRTKYGPMAVSYTHLRPTQEEGRGGT